MVLIIDFCEREKDLKKLYAINGNDKCFCVEGYVYHCDFGKVFQDFNMLMYTFSWTPYMSDVFIDKLPIFTSPCAVLID